LYPYLDELAAGGVRHSWLTPEAAAERWPGMRFDTRARFHPDSGRLHADRSVAALQDAADRRGAVVRHSTPVTSIEVLGDDAVLVHTDHGAYRARRVVADLAVDGTRPDSRFAFR
jgi:sarcosine oxidase